MNVQGNQKATDLEHGSCSSGCRGRWRAGVQGFFLLLFILLAVSAWAPWNTPLPHDLFLRIDPLLWLAGSVANREVAMYGGFALALLLMTALLGRVFCGWACPLGTAMDTIRRTAGSGCKGRASSGWSILRYGVLAGVIGGAVLGVNLTGWLDPLVISMRALHLPSAVGNTWLPVGVGWTLFLGAIGLALVAPRFWCRIICPLGAALSVVARFSWYRRRVATDCTGCDVCSTVCPLGESPARGRTSPCLVCGRCADVCPRRAIQFGPGSSINPEGWKAARQQGLSRRMALFGLGGFVAGGMLGLMPRARTDAGPVRPPGVFDEAEFTARCTGCGACLAVCPTNGLQPTLELGRLDMAFSPELVSRIGPCQPDCTACGEVCPTEAIPRFTAENKWSRPIGVAVIDESRCIPWVVDQRCVICLDACPSEFAAIELRRAGPGPFRPFVRESECTGCGICEHRCPVDQAAAIRVVRTAT